MLFYTHLSWFAFCLGTLKLSESLSTSSKTLSKYVSQTSHKPSKHILKPPPNLRITSRMLVKKGSCRTAKVVFLLFAFEVCDILSMLVFISCIISDSMCNFELYQANVSQVLWRLFQIHWQALLYSVTRVLSRTSFTASLIFFVHLRAIYQKAWGASEVWEDKGASKPNMFQRTDKSHSRLAARNTWHICSKFSVLFTWSFNLSLLRSGKPAESPQITRDFGECAGIQNKLTKQRQLRIGFL